MAETSRHILIYGPPAAGKLTVARCLASFYGLKLLDNHLSVDVALRLFEFGTKPSGRLVERLRVELLGAAAEAGLDVVSTLVFAHPVDRAHVDRLVAASEAHGGVVTFVQLRPETSVLEQRITEPSRDDVRKLRDVATLRTIMERYDLRTPVNPDDLSIDNSRLSPEEVAATIARHAGLEEPLLSLRSRRNQMAAFSIRNIDDDIKERLRVRAAEHGRSMEAEIRAILVEAVSPAPSSAGLFGTILERFGELGGVELDLPPRRVPPRGASLQ